MIEQVVPQNVFWMFYLCAFSISAILIAQRLIQFLRRKPFLRWHEWLNTGLSVMVVAIFAADAMQLVKMETHPVLQQLALIAVVVLTVVASRSLVQLGRRTLREVNSSRSAVAMLLLVAIISAGWSAKRFYTTVEPLSFDFKYERVPGQSLPSTKFIGVTDRGREVELYRWRPDSDQDEQLIRSTVNGRVGDLPTTIQRAEYDVRSNCHGWVFTNGRFLLKGDGVDRILQDNGYEAVTQPQAGDVVIYRIPTNEIAHTGLVQGVLGDGTVIVESKWSVGGRYLHQPDAQPYSSQYTFYRTPRKSHVVTIRYRSPIHATNASESGGTKAISSVGTARLSAAG